jgi:hypothetical protein
MSAQFATPQLLSRSISNREPDALVAREVDGLVSQLLTEIKVPFNSLGKRVLTNLADLKKVLAADYPTAKAMPSPNMLRELSAVVKRDFAHHYSVSKSLDSPEMLGRLFKNFGPREIELRAEPYRQGAGLALRGFFCRTNVAERSKFVIFVNTAHHPGAVAATLGHELGHYIYGSLAGEHTAMTAFMEGTFSAHLEVEDELFADSLVALSAYSKDLMNQIGVFKATKPGSSNELFGRIRTAYSMLQPRFKIDLTKGRMTAAWRVRYLTSMTHFLKLRYALNEIAGL